MTSLGLAVAQKMLRQFGHGRIGAGPAHEAFLRRFAKGQAEFDARHGPDQGFMYVLDRLDEVLLGMPRLDTE